MDRSVDAQVTIKLRDYRHLDDDDGPSLQIVDTPVRLYPTYNPRLDQTEWKAQVGILISSIQNGPSPLEAPAKVYFLQSGARQCILTLREDGSSHSIQGTLPVQEDRTIWLDIENDFNHFGSSSGSSHSSPRSESELAPADEAHVRAALLLKHLPDDSPSGLPKWTPEELAAHDAILASLSDEERAQLISHRFQESRKRQRLEPPVWEYGTGKRLPDRPRRPWETLNSNGDLPKWLRNRQLKRNHQSNQWNPAIRPVYPTFVFSADAGWDIPDNSRYDKVEVNKAVVAYLKTLLVEKPGYWEFTESKGRSLPLIDLLRQYYFAKRMLTELTKIRCPVILPICGGSFVTKENVLLALDRKPSWGSDCLETMELVDLYGPYGKYEDEAVTRAIDEDPEHQMGSVQFLKLLRTTHKLWQDTHPDEHRVTATE